VRSRRTLVRCVRAKPVESDPGMCEYKFVRLTADERNNAIFCEYEVGMFVVGEIYEFEL